MDQPCIYCLPVEKKATVDRIAKRHVRALFVSLPAALGSVKTASSAPSHEIFTLATKPFCRCTKPRRNEGLNLYPTMFGADGFYLSRIVEFDCLWNVI